MGLRKNLGDGTDVLLLSGCCTGATHLRSGTGAVRRITPAGSSQQTDSPRRDWILHRAVRPVARIDRPFEQRSVPLLQPRHGGVKLRQARRCFSGGRRHRLPEKNPRRGSGLLHLGQTRAASQTSNQAASCTASCASTPKRPRSMSWPSTLTQRMSNSRPFSMNPMSPFLWTVSPFLWVLVSNCATKSFS